MASFSIQTGIACIELARKLPKRFQGLVPPRLANGVCTIIIFNGERVVRSPQAQIALQALTDTDPTVLAFAHNLTEEAKALLAARGVQIFTERDYHWTDASYTAVRSHRSERKL
jgi:hypothetical protein